MYSWLRVQYNCLQPKIKQRCTDLNCTKLIRNWRIVKLTLLTVANLDSKIHWCLLVVINVAHGLAGPRIIGTVVDRETHSITPLFQQDSGVADISTAIGITNLRDHSIVTADCNLICFSPSGKASIKLSCCSRHPNCQIFTLYQEKDLTFNVPELCQLLKHLLEIRRTIITRKPCIVGAVLIWWCKRRAF